MQLSGFRRKLCWKKRSLWWQRSLNDWYNRSQSGMHLMYVSHCRNFNAGIKNFNSPHLCYSTNVKSPIAFFFGKKLYSICSYAEIWVWIWGENNFSNIFWNFRTIRILIDQLHILVFLSCFPMKLWCFPFRIGWKNPTCNDEEVWLSGTC